MHSTAKAQKEEENVSGHSQESGIFSQAHQRNQSEDLGQPAGVFIVCIAFLLFL